MAVCVCVCVCVFVCVFVCDCPFACERSTHSYKRNGGVQKGAQILGISETSLASAVTMAEAVGGTPVFESALL